MNRWRVIIVALVVGALAVMVLAGLPWAQSLPWPPRTAFATWPSELPMRWRTARPAIAGLAGEAAGLLASFLLAVVVAFVIPRRVRHMAESLHPGGRSLGRIFLTGLACTVLAAAVSILAVFSVHMVPVPFLLIGIVFLASLVGVVAITFELGRELLVRAGWYSDRPLLALALGTLLTFSLSRLPIVGWLTLIALWLTGAGVAVATRIGGGRPWTLRPLVEGTHE